MQVGRVECRWMMEMSSGDDQLNTTTPKQEQTTVNGHKTKVNKPEQRSNRHKLRAHEE